VARGGLRGAEGNAAELGNALGDGVDMGVELGLRKPSSIK
jgi:hypothetical protein